MKPCTQLEANTGRHQICEGSLADLGDARRLQRSNAKGALCEIIWYYDPVIVDEVVE